jgi:hypothetical protein
VVAAGDVPAGVVAIAFTVQRKAEGVNEQLAALRWIGGDTATLATKERSWGAAYARTASAMRELRASLYW